MSFLLSVIQAYCHWQPRSQRSATHQADPINWWVALRRPTLRELAMRAIGSSLRRLSIGRRSPRGLLGMLGLVLAVEGFMARHDADYGNYLAIDWARNGPRRHVGGRSALVGPPVRRQPGEVGAVPEGHRGPHRPTGLQPGVAGRSGAVELLPAPAGLARPGRDRRRSSSTSSRSCSARGLASTSRAGRGCPRPAIGSNWPGWLAMPRCSPS